MSKSRRGGCGCKGIKGALPPMPEPEEMHEGYMLRCETAGFGTEDCQQRWDEETAEEDQEEEQEGESMPMMPGMSKTLPLRMAGADTAELLLYDEIGGDAFFGGVTAKAFREQVKGITARTLNLRINSPGGSVVDAAAMLNTLDDWKKVKGRTLEVDIDGLAASAASVVAMAGTTIRMASNSLMMIHDPLAGVLGGAGDMRRMADLLEKVKGQILDAYQRKSRQPRDTLAAWMAGETWFTGQEAVNAGLADTVNGTLPVAALAGGARLFARFGYRHPPKVVEDATARAWEETRRRQKIAASL